MIRDGFTRRDALRAAGSAIAATGAVGLAAGDADRRVYTVGYSSPRGERDARNRAEEVRYEFGFDALTIETSREAARKLANNPHVRYVEADAEYEALEQTLPWGIDRVDAEVTHANGETGDGAHVAIIDTGIDSTHPDLEANLGEGQGYLLGVESGWEDDNGHGTHCAGIADAIDNDEGVVGVSTTATLHAVKVLSSTGVGTTSDIARGIEWVADQGYAVGSLSLGGGSSETLRDACDYAAQEGVTLVAAAGNDGPCTDCVSYPAAYESVVAVSATSEDDSLADFSSTGPQIDLAAPGEDIYSTYYQDSYTTLSGTSMACPHVSGAATQLAADGLSRSEIRQQLFDSAEDIGLGENEQGNGLLDAAAALGYDSSDDL